jgi:hypothetical protein
VQKDNQDSIIVMYIKVNITSALNISSKYEQIKNNAKKWQFDIKNIFLLKIFVEKWCLHII